MKGDKVSVGLSKAADHITTYGLHKGDSFADPEHKETSAVCIHGGIELYCYIPFVHEDSDDAFQKAHEAWNTAVIRTRKAVGVALLSYWNDDPSTTQDMVVNALREAANE